MDNHTEQDTQSNVATETHTPAKRVTFRGRPKTQIVVGIPQRRTAEDRGIFGEFDGQDKLDAVAAEIAESMASKINSKGGKLDGVTPYSREYITSRVVWLLSRAIA